MQLDSYICTNSHIRNIMKSVVICSSQRFKKEVDDFAKKLEKLGVPLVLAPDFRYRTAKVAAAPESVRLKSASYRKGLEGLVRAHLHRIQKADVCFIYNKKGYVGYNTTLELGAAAILGKLIFALEEDTHEPCRHILFDKIIKTPEDLARYLV